MENQSNVLRKIDVPTEILKNEFHFQTGRPQISAVVENSGLNCQLIINYM